MEDFTSLLLEAKDPKTNSDRLWEIQELGFSDLDSEKRSTLIVALVDHPNAEEEFCFQLLRQWPSETLASTRFQLLLLADNEINWEEIFQSFSETLPALDALKSITRSHKAIIRLFESALLSRFDQLSCSFDWNMTCTHEISVDWNPGLNTEEEASEENEYEEIMQAFTITCSASIDSGNSAVLSSPGSVDDISILFAELDSCDGNERLFEILKKHGWGCDTEYTGDGGYFEIESVEPELEGWEDFSGSLMGDASGTLCITDPTGAEHECELPEGDIEDSFENYRLDDSITLSDLFENDESALEAFRAIINTSV